MAIDFRGDEAKLIDDLVASGWLDSGPVERLVVHDWADHADDVRDAIHQLTGERIRQKQRKYTCAHRAKGRRNSFPQWRNPLLSGGGSAPMAPNRAR